MVWQCVYRIELGSLLCWDSTFVFYNMQFVLRDVNDHYTHKQGHDFSVANFAKFHVTICEILRCCYLVSSYDEGARAQNYSLQRLDFIVL